VKRGFLIALAAGALLAPDYSAEAYNFWDDDETALSEEAPEESAKDAVILHGFDKITARVSELRIPLNENYRFGSLEIVARYCRKRPPEETPEVTAFLEISDVQPGKEPQRLFTGWMFASSPALSALEHPVYDVWVTSCTTSAPDMSVGKE